ncbi:MAG: SBBP repeat-containing protein [Chitinophagales bacterium]|nr:SBBP repeat-containing protein [Chitinophagales bacterium]
MKTILLLFIALANICVVSASSVAPFSHTFKSGGFVQNKGQIKNQYGLVNDDVKYLYSNGFFNLQLRKNGFSYEIFEAKKSAIFLSAAEDDEDLGQQQKVDLSSSRIDVILLGANASPEMVAEEGSGTYFNYFITPSYKKGIEHVLAFNKITYKNIYPGIDLVFTDDLINNTVEYSYVIRPNANPALIRMQYLGTSGIAIDKFQHLNIQAEKGFVSEINLSSFTNETKKEVPCRLTLENNEVSFSVGSVVNETLVIDPNIIWGTYFGGEIDEKTNPEITVDQKGKPILVGTTSSTTLIASSGAFQTRFSGVCDFCISKFKTDGNLDWATYFGGSGQDIAYGITSDDGNNIYVAGNTTSDGLATPGAHLTTRAGQGDAILAKFSSTGGLLWSTYYGGFSPDQARSVCIDNSGHVFIAGYCNSTTGISTPGVYQETYGGYGDAFVAMFSSNGTLRWGSYLGGTKQDRIHAVSVDKMGAVYIEGTCESTSGIATPGAYQTVFGGATDALVAKFDTSNGNIFWSTYYGGEAEDHGRGVVCDSKGNVYIAGFTGSLNNIATPGAYQELLNLYGQSGGFDGLVVKFTSDGERIWGTYYGGEGNDPFYGMAIDNNSNIYIAGSTKSISGIATANAIQGSIGGDNNSDGALAKFDNDGHLLMGTYWGETAQEIFYDVDVDDKGFAFAACRTEGTVEVTPGVYQTQNNGGADYAVYKIYAGDNCYDINEPNETLSSSKLLKATTDTSSWGYSASISSSTDQDWFKIKTKADGTNLKILLMYPPKTYTLKLCGDDGATLDSSRFQGPDTQTIIFNNNNTGSFYIQVVHTNTQFDSLNCYRLLIIKSSTPFSVPQKDLSPRWNSKANESDFRIDPNPACTQVNVHFISDKKGMVTGILYDMLCHPVFMQQFEVDEGIVEHQFTLPLLTSGSYIFEWKQNDIIHRKQLVINQ